MKSVMEDFADIAARLNQIEQEKRPKKECASGGYFAIKPEECTPVDDSDGSAKKTPNGIAWDSVSVDDIYGCFAVQI